MQLHVIYDHSEDNACRSKGDELDPSSVFVEHQKLIQSLSKRYAIKLFRFYVTYHHN